MADIRTVADLMARSGGGPNSVGSLLLPMTANPLMARKVSADREAQFMAGIKATPWYKEFQQTYGEEPDLSPSADYDYRSAWAAGIRPTPDPHDGGRYHWPSSLPNGAMLKSPTHPTAWKEHYMRATGQNPDAIGATEADWMRMRK